MSKINISLNFSILVVRVASHDEGQQHRRLIKGQRMDNGQKKLREDNEAVIKGQLTC